MWWSVADLDDWLQVAHTTHSKYVRHAEDPRFKTRVLAAKSHQKDVGAGSYDVQALPAALLAETLADLIRRIGGDPRVTVVMRDFPFEHAPDIGVLIDPRLPYPVFKALHTRSCIAVATSLALLKARLDKHTRADKRQERHERHERPGGKRSGVIIQGRAGARFVETPFLPQAPTVQLLQSDVYLTHHQPTFYRDGEDGTVPRDFAIFDLFRMRVAGAGGPDQQALDVVVYESLDSELQRLHPQLNQTEATAVPGLLRWSQAHLLREMNAALMHPRGGYMEYKWERLRRETTEHRVPGVTHGAAGTALPPPPSKMGVA